VTGVVRCDIWRVKLAVRSDDGWLEGLGVYSFFLCFQMLRLYSVSGDLVKVWSVLK
jgi:hypothetical protein